MRPIRLSYAPADAALTRYLSNATGATWTLTETESSDELAHTVTIKNDSVTDHSGKTAILTGTDFADRVLTETVSLPGASLTVTSTRYFKTLLTIVPSATIGADTMDIGQGNGFSSAVIPLDWRSGIIAVNLDLTGTIDATVQQTFDDVQDQEDFDYVWQDAPSTNLVNAIASVSEAYEGLPTALRVITNSSVAPATLGITLTQRNF